MATTTRPFDSEFDSRSMVVAVFRDRAQANLAHEWLLARGYTESEITTMMSTETRGHFEREGKFMTASHAVEGVAAGGTIGTAIGATAAAIAAIGTSLVVPGFGIIAGPLAAALAGGGAGAVAGGAIGGLIGLGIPESNARAYEAALRDGGVVLGVVPHEGDTSEIKTRFEQLDGENVHTC